ncbi:hypothetical protein ACFL3H_07355 [Gemmatimonadota bacterium]
MASESASNRPHDVLHEVGSLEAGKFADLIVFSDNPRSVDKFSISDIQVLATMIGGEVLFGQLIQQ